MELTLRNGRVRFHRKRTMPFFDINYAAIRRNRFKNFDVCMGFCESAMKIPSVATSATAETPADPYDVEEPVLGPRPDTVEEDVESSEVYSDYDPERCEVRVLLL